MNIVPGKNDEHLTICSCYIFCSETSKFASVLSLLLFQLMSCLNLVLRKLSQLMFRTRGFMTSMNMAPSFRVGG